MALHWFWFPEWLESLASCDPRGGDKRRGGESTSCCGVKGLDKGAVSTVREGLLGLPQGMAALWAMQGFRLSSFLKSYIGTCHKGVGWTESVWELLIEDKESEIKSYQEGKNHESRRTRGNDPKETHLHILGTGVTQVETPLPTFVFICPPSSPSGTQRVKVYSGLGLQPHCLEPLGSWVHMPFLAGLWSPWCASPAPDPHSAEGALQFLLRQKAHHHRLYPCGPLFPWQQVRHLSLWASPAFSYQDSQYMV